MPVRKLIAIFLIQFLILPGDGFPQNLDLSGGYRGEFEVGLTDSIYSDQHWVNLIYEKNFGMDASMHLDLEFNTYESDALTSLFREAYLNYYTPNIDWRLGKQIISWGSSYLLGPTSYFSPYDLTVLNPGEKHMGVLAGTGTLYGPWRTEFSMVITPFFATHMQTPGSESAMLNHSIEQTIRSINRQIPLPGIRVVSDPQQPVVPGSVRPTVENTQGGIKLTKRDLSGFDLSLSGYHGRDRFPVVDEEATAGSFHIDPRSAAELDTLVTVHFTYPEVSRAGWDIIGGIGGIGVWLEGSYSMYRSGQLNDNLNLVVGADYKFKNDFYLMGQAWYLGKRIDGEQEIRALLTRFSFPVYEFHSLEMVFLYDLESQSYFLQPQLDYSLGNAVGLEIGGTLLEMGESPYTPLIGKIMGDRFFTRLHIDF